MRHGITRHDQILSLTPEIESLECLLLGEVQRHSPRTYLIQRQESGCAASLVPVQFSYVQSKLHKSMPVFICLVARSNHHSEPCKPIATRGACPMKQGELHHLGQVHKAHTIVYKKRRYQCAQQLHCHFDIGSIHSRQRSKRSYRPVTDQFSYLSIQLVLIRFSGFALH